jgi:copper chaperone
MSNTGNEAVTSTYGVSGMTCSHCVNSVTEEMSQLDGVQNVSIDLVADGVSTVTVTSAGVLNRDAVLAAVDEAGYQLVDANR